MSQSSDFSFDADFYKSNDGVFKVIQMVSFAVNFTYMIHALPGMTFEQFL